MKMRGIATLFLLFAGIAGAETAKRPSKKMWVISTVALVAANVLDVHSSYGGREMNPIMRSANGRFGMRGVGLKAGVSGGLIVSELFLMRSKKLSPTVASVLNFGGAGLSTSVAVRNYRVR